MAAREGLDAGVLRVVAPAGYGKSTLIAQAVLEDSPAIWISAKGPAGSAPIRALARSCGLVDDALRPHSAAETADADEVVDRFCRALDAAGLAGAVLVVDDAHHLDEAGVAQATALVARAPHGLRLVLASRCALPDGLAAPRPDAVMIGVQHLSLDADDCGALLASVGHSCTPEEAERHVHETEGWITGVLLRARSGGDPGEYLLREGVDQLPAAAARMLEDLCVLDRFTPDLAAVVSGHEDASQLLHLVFRRGGFVVPPPDGGRPWWRLHSMLRRALEGRAAARPGDRHVLMHHRAAEGLTAMGDPEEAARHHVAAGDLGGAVDALRMLSRRDEDHGQVRELLGTVPARAWSDAPGSVLAMASHLFYRADHQRAFESMEAAAHALAEASDLDRARVVVVRLLRAAPLAGGLYQRTISMARGLLPHLGTDPVLIPAALTMLGLMLGECGDYEGAEAELDLAVEESRGEPLALARVAATRAFAVDFPQGRADHALAALDGAVPVLEAHPDDPLNYLLYALAFRSLLLADTGRFDEALAESGRFARAAASLGLERLGRPVTGMLRLIPLAGRGRWDELGSEVARGAPAAGRLRGALRSYRYDVAMARLAAAEGDLDRLTTASAAARARLDEHGLPYDAAMALADLSACATSVGALDLAAAMAADSYAAAARARAPWALTRAAIAMARALGPCPEGDRALADAIRRSAGGRLDALWAGREREAAAHLLPRAAQQGIGDPGTVARLATACAGVVRGAPPDVPATAGPTPIAASASPAANTPVVHLTTLGLFAVQRDGTLVADAEFGRRKARTLLAVLLCARRAVHRDALIELLWPDLPERRGLAALHSTLHALRRTLEPGLGTGQCSSIVVAEGVSYRIALGPRATWDADIFLRTAEHAHREPEANRINALIQAAALYGGPLLPEWSSASWVRPLATEVEEAHRQLLAGAADLMARSGQHAEAIARYRLLLAIEPERESWHRALMETYVGAGERALALRQYQACRERMLDDLGVEPSRMTRDLHTRILREP
jgi:DNA-binding SARP family transcriptional activator